ncbi:MAG: cyclic nucleotide-binding domain-containing protein, partial [bacterium]
MYTEHGPLLPKMSSNDLALLSSYGVPRRYPRHSILINKGDDAAGLYVIEEGRVKVFISDESGSEVILRYQEAGEFFGELALLDERPRTASVATLEDTRMVYVSVARFEQCLRESPDLSAKMVRHLISQ